MADETVQADSVPANSEPLISDLAVEIQLLLNRISYLTRALEDASDDANILDECTRTALDRVVSFSQLIDEQARRGHALASQVERLDRDEMRSQFDHPASRSKGGKHGAYRP